MNHIQEEVKKMLFIIYDHDTLSSTDMPDSHKILEKKTLQRLLTDFFLNSEDSLFIILDYSCGFIPNNYYFF